MSSTNFDIVSSVVVSPQKASAEIPENFTTEVPHDTDATMPKLVLEVPLELRREAEPR